MAQSTSAKQGQQGSRAMGVLAQAQKGHTDAELVLASSAYR